jgi:hypothetical protein
MNRIWAGYLRPYLTDIILSLVLAAIGLISFRMLISVSPFLYGDHPVHYYTFSYALQNSFLTHYRLIDWNPNWFAGFPALQFYPPGLTLVGMGIYFLGFGLLSIGLIYNLLILITLIFPAVSTYWSMRSLGFEIIPSFFSALFFLILTYIGSAGGFYYGVIIGLTSSRIALGLFPLVLAFAINHIYNPNKLWISLGFAISLALTVLFHPDHIFFPLIGIVAVILVLHIAHIRSIFQSLKLLLFPIILAAGLSAFWWLPLLIQHNYIAAMQVWSFKYKLSQDLSGLFALFTGLWDRDTNKFILLLYLVAIPYLFRKTAKSKEKSIFIALLLTPIFILVFILFVQFVVIGIGKLYLFDPARLIDGVYASIILVSGLGVYYILESAYRFLGNWKESIRHKVGALVFLALIFSILYFTSFRLQIFYRYPGIFNPNAFSNYIDQSYQLPELWNYLQHDSPGRILFTAIGVPIKGIPANFKAQLMALTPKYTGRQIIGGVNTPFYPVASYLYFGQKTPVIHIEADKFDNRSLFGTPWEQMEQSQLTEFCKKLNITDIVVNRNEDKVIDFFNRSSSFRLAQEIDDFKIYTIPDYVPNWIEFDISKADILVTSFKANTITLSVNSATTTIPVLVKMAYYPCWKVFLINSAIRNPQSAINISADEIGLMHLVLPQGERYQIELIYRTSWAEKVGWIITFLSIIAIIASSFISKRKKSIPTSLL